jgi:PEP-CTERM motif
MLQNSVEQGGLPALTAGDMPVLTFWAKGTAGATGNLVFALRYLDGIGNILYNSNNQNFQGAINTGAYSKITFNGGVVPAGATAAFIEFSQGIGPVGIGPAGENFFAGLVLIDDINLQVADAVPEPGTYAMMLTGAVLFGSVVRRRRRAA